MNRLASTIAATAAATMLPFASSTPATAQKVEHVYGPQPDWAEYRRLAEAAIAASLIDPESARFTWLTGMHKSGIKPFLSSRILGWAACGTVNAKNRLGGYTGATTFLVAIDNGRVLGTAVDERPNGLYAAACAKAIGNGLFPPPPPDTPVYAAPGTTAPTPIPTTASVPAASAATGLALRGMPEGAYITVVTPGSPAAAAGLKPGMVIASVNAVPLAGLGEAMTRVVDAAGAAATLTLVDGRSVKLGGAK